MQLEDDFAPTAFEYMPAEHEVQGPLPEAENWPATHGPDE